MNLVGNFGVQQGTSGDLLIGLPTQVCTCLAYFVEDPSIELQVHPTTQSHSLLTN